jgi:hypothetical protein
LARSAKTAVRDACLSILPLPFLSFVGGACQPSLLNGRRQRVENRGALSNWTIPNCAAPENISHVTHHLRQHRVRLSLEACRQRRPPTRVPLLMTLALWNLPIDAAGEPRRPFIWKATGGGRLCIFRCVCERTFDGHATWKATERSPLAEMEHFCLAGNCALFSVAHDRCLQLFPCCAKLVLHCVCVIAPPCVFSPPCP